MKDKKNKLAEETITPSSTAMPNVPDSASSTGGQKTPTMYVKKNDLPSVKSSIKDTDANVVVTEDNMQIAPEKLSYLSEVKDEKGGISKPFNINGKNYQMCRARNSDKKEVMGVYSLDEKDEEGNNIIHDVKTFESTIAKQHQPERQQDIEETGSKETSASNFIGFKHFLVNKKSGKFKKFKGVQELARANMSEDEEYMGLKNFKKYIDETLFGARKQGMKEDDVSTQVSTSTTNPTQPTSPAGTQIDAQLQEKATQLINMIKQKIPSSIFSTITTPEAKNEVILAFAEFIGVDQNHINELITRIKGMGSTSATN